MVESSNIKILKYRADKYDANNNVVHIKSKTKKKFWRKNRVGTSMAIQCTSMNKRQNNRLLVRENKVVEANGIVSNLFFLNLARQIETDM